MIVCIGSCDSYISIYEVGDLMHKKGWALNSLQHPAGLHICCTLRTVGQHQRFLRDLRKVSIQSIVGVCPSTAKCFYPLAICDSERGGGEAVGFGGPQDGQEEEDSGKCRYLRDGLGSSCWACQ